VGIPIIGSLNGVSIGGWVKYARLIEEAGADVLELNVYFVPTDRRLAGAHVDEATVELVREVRNCVRIPLAVKLRPFYSNVAALAHQLVEVACMDWCCSTASTSQTSASTRSTSPRRCPWRR